MEEYKKVTISFTKEQLEKLDEIMSKEQGYSRSSLVREAVDYYLGYLAQKGSVSTKKCRQRAFIYGLIINQRLHRFLAFSD